MADLLLDLVTRLTTQGLVQGDGIDTFRDMMPATPDRAIAIVEYQGTNVAFVSLAVRNIQISVRDVSYDGAKSKISAIYNYFNQQEPIFDADSTGRWFVAIPKHPPYKLDKDANDRTTFIFNCIITTYND